VFRGAKFRLSHTEILVVAQSKHRDLFLLTGWIVFQQGLRHLWSLSRAVAFEIQTTMDKTNAEGVGKRFLLLPWGDWERI
jgi:hypothetical protein